MRDWYDYDLSKIFSEELVKEGMETSKKYIFKLLDYSSDEKIPDEELERMRAIFAFSKVGPRSWTHRFDKTTKLTSGDVLYILTSTLPSEFLGKQFGVNGRKIREIRTNERNTYNWEYELVRRLSTRLRDKLKEDLMRSRSIYEVQRLIGEGTYESLFLCSSLVRARNMLKETIKEKEYNKMVEEGTLDIIYPIHKREFF